MKKMWLRVTVGEVGWIEYDVAAPPVRAGDRLLPPELFVHFPSDEVEPGLRMTLAVVDGVPQCRELHLESKPGGREVRTTDLRNLPLETWIHDLYALAASRIVSDEAGVVTAVDEVDPERQREARKVVERMRAASRRTITDDLLQRVAEIYRANVAQRPTESVRQALGVEHRTAAKYVQLARRKGFLPPTTAGRKQA